MNLKGTCQVARMPVKFGHHIATRPSWGLLRPIIPKYLLKQRLRVWNLNYQPLVWYFHAVLENQQKPDFGLRLNLTSFLKGKVRGSAHHRSPISSSILLPRGEARRETMAWAPVATGEILLGHPDEDGRIERLPANQALRTNGSYMALRSSNRTS